MTWGEWDRIYVKLEPSPLDRFKNKNKLLKAFGAAGVQAYDAIDGAKTARQVQVAVTISESEFAKIMDFMIENGPMVSMVSAPQGAPVDISRRMPPSPSPPGMAMPGAASTSGARMGGAASAGMQGAQAPGARSAVPDAKPSGMSPIEKTIFDRYGAAGVKVYELIDGERTAEDILNETGLSETKLVEILEFMNDQGIIKLERPVGKASSSLPPGMPGSTASMGAGASAPKSVSRRTSEDGVGFKPMVEGTGEAEDDVMSLDSIPVDVPVVPPNMSMFQKAQMGAILRLKFPKFGAQILSHVDGQKDFVQIALETGLSLQEIDVVFGELGKSGLLMFKPLNRTEVRHRYGDDGLAIYKRYGRDGLMVYELIGKVTSLKEIARRTKLEPKKAVDIIIFVHQVLGLELPLDKEMIFRYISTEKN